MIIFFIDHAKKSIKMCSCNNIKYLNTVNIFYHIGSLYPSPV